MSRLTRRAGIALGSTLAAGALLAPGAGAQLVTGAELISPGSAEEDVSYDGSTPDTARAYFSTSEALVAADTDEALTDLYEGAGARTRLISTGPDDDGLGFMELIRASPDGARVLFWTNAPLDAADTDETADIYARIGDETMLASGGDEDADAVYQGETTDAARAWFVTTEPLAAADEDDVYDVYEWSADADGVELVSTGPEDGPDAEGMAFEGASADGSRVFFSSALPLTEEDADDELDLYMREAGGTTLVTPAPAVAGEVVDPVDLLDVSADGTRVYISTEEGLLAEDEDGARDLYVLSGGEATLLTPGTEDGESLDYENRTAGGARIFFSTAESLEDADTDSSVDIYERAGGRYTLLSSGTGAQGGEFEALWSREVAERVFFRTDEQLVAEDGDEDRDVYARDGDELTLISNDGAGDDRPVLEDVSADGRRVVYSLSTDDVYVNDGGTAVELISEVFPQRLSPDGSRLIVTTDVALAPGDADSTRDVYRLALAVTPRNTAAPTVSGTAAVGRTLTCSPGTWSGGAVTYAYRWNRDGAAIAGAAGATRESGTADAGRALTCTVTGTNAAGSVSATSAAVTVAPAGGPGGGPGGPPEAAPTPGACATVRTGTSAADVLVGTNTGDRLRGLAGGDVLRGLAGADCLTGGRGPDRLVGGKGADRMEGGRGADELAGGKGADALAGGRGADVIRARDGRAETVRCGAGRDTAVADRDDRLRGCERKRQG